MVMRVLVCGGRRFADRNAVYSQLSRLHETDGISVVIEGGSTGADNLACDWAHEHGVKVLTFAAEWGKYGRAAGPVRNLTMLRDGRPDLVVAFQGGSGTADMVRRALAKDIRVIQVPA